jgi:GAF domain-containing protein
MGSIEVLAQQFRHCRDERSVADRLLDLGLQLSQTALGNVQLMNWKRGYLEINVQSGFSRDFLDFFKQVHIEDASACARALRNRSSIIIEDITADQQFAPCRDILAKAGVRAVQSTPMTSSSGALIGILSTHFPKLHLPTGIEMRNLRHAAHLAADAIIAIRANNANSVDAINSSIELVQDAQKAIEITERLLAHGPFGCVEQTVASVGTPAPPAGVHGGFAERRIGVPSGLQAAPAEKQQVDGQGFSGGRPRCGRPP